MTPRRLNLGCGFDKREGWLNVDNFEGCEPDVLVDIEQPPWPLDDNAFDHILLHHVLEHVGAEFGVFADVMRELYRVAAPGAVIEVVVPNFKHDSFFSDPTHVRAFTPLTFEMMSKKRNDQWIANRANMTMLAYLLDVDFEVIGTTARYDPNWWARHQAGEFTLDELRQAAQERWGVIVEIQTRLRVVK